MQVDLGPGSSDEGGQPVCRKGQVRLILVEGHVEEVDAGGARCRNGVVCGVTGVEVDAHVGVYDGDDGLVLHPDIILRAGPRVGSILIEPAYGGVNDQDLGVAREQHGRCIVVGVSVDHETIDLARQETRDSGVPDLEDGIPRGREVSWMLHCGAVPQN